jgi:hypothetical protein
MLDEFSTTKIDDQEKSPLPSGPGRPIEPIFTNANDDFAKELQAEMAELLGEVETSVRETIPPKMRTGS